jgi:hypothetical protein
MDKKYEIKKWSSVRVGQYPSFCKKSIADTYFSFLNNLFHK